MPIAHPGEFAALGTAACWTATALSFEAAGRRVGSLAVNLVRMVLALGLLTLAAGAARGRFLPLDASAHAWGWLGLSGLVGFTFGDLCLYRAFVVLGSRLSTLVMSAVPLLTALLGWWVLGEVLSAGDLAGMGLTVAGIAWAILDRGGSRAAPPNRPVAGVALALGGALGQAGGLVLSKLGMGSYPALAATQIRVFVGLLGYLGIAAALSWWRRAWSALGDRRAMVFTGLGAFFGPFLGVTLSLVAIRFTATGVAASIMATTPILILPAAVVWKGERVGWGGALGAVLAVAGVALLFR